MKLKEIINYLVIAAVLLLGSNVFAQDMEQIREKVDATNATLIKAMLEDDHDTIISLYTDDCWSLPSYASILKGKAAIRKAGEEQKKNPMKVNDFKLKTVEVYAEGNWVMDIGKYEITVEVPEMEMPWTDKGKYVTIFEMQSDGTLLMKLDTWNTDMNPWEMMQKEKEHDKGKPHKKKIEKKAKSEY